MAARRLIIVMIVLLGISTAIAIVVPEPRQRDTEEESATTGTSGAAGATGSIDADDPLGIDDSGPAILVEAAVKPDSEADVVRASSGNRLILTVESEEPAVVEIEALGLTQTTSEYAPAIFDVIVPEQPEVIEVTTTEGDRPIATIDTRA